MKKVIVIFFIFSLTLFAQLEGDVKVPYIDFPMKKGKGEYSTRGKCNMCHSFGYVINQGEQSKAFWREKTLKMIKVFNAPIRLEDVDIVVDYLYANYGNSQEDNRTISGK